MPSSRRLLESIQIVARINDAFLIHTKLVRRANSGQTIHGHRRARRTVDVENLLLTAQLSDACFAEVLRCEENRRKFQ